MLFQFSAKRDGVHKEFQKAIEAAVCRYVPEKGMLSVMVSNCQLCHIQLFCLS